MRTIIIARSAEDRFPVFSSADIARYAGIPDLKSVIDNRNQKDAEGLDAMARRVAKRWAEDQVSIEWPSDKPAQRKLMKERGRVPADTLKFIQPKALLKKGSLMIRDSADAPSQPYE